MFFEQFENLTAEKKEELLNDIFQISRLLARNTRSTNFEGIRNLRIFEAIRKHIAKIDFGTMSNIFHCLTKDELNTLLTDEMIKEICSKPTMVQYPSLCLRRLVSSEVYDHNIEIILEKFHQVVNSVVLESLQLDVLADFSHAFPKELLEKAISNCQELININEKKQYRFLLSFNSDYIDCLPQETIHAAINQYLNKVLPINSDVIQKFKTNAFERGTKFAFRQVKNDLQVSSVAFFQPGYTAQETKESETKLRIST